jgi:hypothetical protein
MTGHDYEPPDDDAPEETVTDKELNALIDELLTFSRPERYDADDKIWMDPVVDEIRDKLIERMDPRQVAADNAQRRVYAREGGATRRTNKILRSIAETHQLPLGWGDGPMWMEMLRDIIRLPLSIDRKRVRFGAMGPNDWEQWELQHRREAADAHNAASRAADGAKVVGKWCQEQSVHRTDDLRERYRTHDGDA